MEKTYYGSICAYFYDLDKPYAPQDALIFYMSHAKQGDAILEPMCGSGRFLVPFAQAGFDIDGFDVSADMLARIKHKLPAHAGSLNHCGFDLKPLRRYNYIFIPAGSFSLITGDDDILTALANMKEWLAQDGKILVEVETDANLAGYTAPPGPPSAVQDGSKTVVASSRFVGYNQEKSVVSTICMYGLMENNQMIASQEEDFCLKLYRGGEFEKYAEMAGLTVVNRFEKLDTVVYQLS